ncbi:MAG: hypothetical protein M3Z04_16575 [Chloroflexota bacterium]|nr:hypothetical protein [Chloroflexota bacterium]
MRAPVEKAVDWVIGKAVAGLKKVGGLFTGKGKSQGSGPSKDAAKGTAPGSTPADPKAAGTPQPNAAQPGADVRTMDQKQKDLNAGLAAANTLVQNEHLKYTEISKQLPSIKAKYHMTALTLVVDKLDTAAGKETIHVHGEVNSSGNTPTGNKNTPLRSPADRHYIRKVTQRSVAKDKNTVVEPTVPVVSDVAAINAGQATQSGDTFTINGRIYGTHDGVLYPMSGTGFYELDRGAYKALGVYNKFGDTPQAGTILDNMGIAQTQRAAALQAWRAGGGS